MWAAQITDKILRPYLKRAWLRAACVLAVFLAEHLLFEISTYMVDLLALPLLLEATYLTLRADEGPGERSGIFHVSLLLGISTAFKITNLAVALPLMLLWAYRFWKQRRLTTQLKTSALALVIFLLPLLPFSIYIYRVTGNPVFPVGNVFLKSPYWPTHGWDNRWGPKGIWETIVWPVSVVFHPERYSELAFYSGRLSIGVAAAVIGIVLVWKNAYLRQLCFILLGSCLLLDYRGARV